jgi:hypothetical protein
MMFIIILLLRKPLKAVTDSHAKVHALVVEIARSWGLMSITDSFVIRQPYFECRIYSRVAWNWLGKPLNRSWANVGHCP